MTDPQTQPGSDDTAPRPPKPGGKGRPTPKRSEAEKRRKKPAAPPPKDRKEAARRARELARERRLEYRKALREGDERNLPPLHAGPERAVVRDAVDARPALAGFVIVGWLVLLVFGLAPVEVLRVASSLGLFGLVGLLVGDAVVTTRAVRRALAEHFPNGTKESTGRLVRYGLAREVSLRRNRLPPPRVEARRRRG